MISKNLAIILALCCFSVSPAFGAGVDVHDVDSSEAHVTAPRDKEAGENAVVTRETSTDPHRAREEASGTARLRSEANPNDVASDSSRAISEKIQAAQKVQTVNSSEFKMGWNHWNRIMLSDGAELGVTVMQMTVDYGLAVGFSLRGAFYYSHVEDGNREIFNDNPPIQKFDVQDLGFKGKYLVMKGPKADDGSRLVIKIKLAASNLDTGILKIGGIQLEQETSNGFFAKPTTTPLTAYNSSAITEIKQSKVKQLNTIMVGSITGSTDGNFAVPAEVKK